ncbi:MAG: hypothetical protein O7D34_00515 [Ignavibacteria bacterium]|nr:hypothetical protein [Ignavibacteria bacterium]
MALRLKASRIAPGRQTLIEPDVGDVCNPELVDTRWDDLSREIRIYTVAMTGVGGGDPVPTTQTKQIILAHEGQNTLMIDLVAPTMQERCYPSISIAGELKTDALNQIVQLLSLRLTCVPKHFVAQAHVQQESVCGNSCCVVRGPARQRSGGPVYTASGVAHRKHVHL